MADAAAERRREVPLDDLAEAAQLALDRLRLADQRPQDAVLDPLEVDEVVAVDLGAGLELAVDPAVALLHPARVPGDVDVEEVVAMRLEVQALAGRVGGDQDADGVELRVGVEGPLDLLALGLRASAR